MGKVKSKAIGIALVGFMTLGSFASIVPAMNQSKIVYAGGGGASEEYWYVQDKISHLQHSVFNNYAGLKNLATWQGYIKEIEGLIVDIPKSEVFNLNFRLDRTKELINYIARVNQVEKSYEVNYHGIKNAAQWRIYLDLAKEDRAQVTDLYAYSSVYAETYAEMDSRYAVIEAKIKAIEDAHAADLAKVQDKLNTAKESMKIEDAEAALAEANKLGTHETTSKIKQEIEDLIQAIKNK